jgi:hypothetical protein
MKFFLSNPPITSMGVPKGRKLEGAGTSNSKIFAKVKIVKNLTSESKYGMF